MCAEFREQIADLALSVLLSPNVSTSPDDSFSWEQKKVLKNSLLAASTILWALTTVPKTSMMTSLNCPASRNLTRLEGQTWPLLRKWPPPTGSTPHCTCGSQSEAASQSPASSVGNTCSMGCAAQLVLLDIFCYTPKDEIIHISSNPKDRIASNQTVFRTSAFLGLMYSKSSCLITHMALSEYMSI